MPLNKFKCSGCGSEVRTFKKSPLACECSESAEWKIELTVPNSDMKENKSPITGKSKLKNLKGILKERARNHSRDTELHKTIQIAKDSGLDKSVHQYFLNDKGEKRKKIDDR